MAEIDALPAVGLGVSVRVGLAVRLGVTVGEAVGVGRGVLVAEGVGDAVAVGVTISIGNIPPPGHAKNRMPSARTKGMTKRTSPNRFMEDQDPRANGRPAETSYDKAEALTSPSFVLPYPRRDTAFILG